MEPKAKRSDTEPPQGTVPLFVRLAEPRDRPVFTAIQRSRPPSLLSSRRRSRRPLASADRAVPTTMAVSERRRGDPPQKGRRRLPAAAMTNGSESRPVQRGPQRPVEMWHERPEQRRHKWPAEETEVQMEEWPNTRRAGRLEGCAGQRCAKGLAQRLVERHCR